MERIADGNVFSGSCVCFSRLIEWNARRYRLSTFDGLADTLDSRIDMRAVCMSGYSAQPALVCILAARPFILSNMMAAESE